MNEEEIHFQKRLAIEGIRSGANTSIGVAVLATGFGMLVASMTLFFQHDATGANNLLFSGIALMVIGAFLIIFLAFDSKKRICDLKPNLPDPCSKDNIVQEKTPQVENDNSYTGKKYYATRKRMSYHPPDKMFPNETDKSNYVQKQEPKKQRGMLPKGFSNV